MLPEQTDWTHGSDDRGARPLTESLMAFDLRGEIDSLRGEPAWKEGDRNARTLVKSAGIRLLLASLREGAEIQEQHGEGPVSVQLLEGRATLTAGGADVALEAGALASIEAGLPWSLRAEAESALLVTFAWTEGAGERS
ncbi:hypothetical protein BH24CHL8_BH24CHL8_08110 [soil metagenome]